VSSTVQCNCNNSAGLERIFSSYGLVHSKLRNKFGNKKAAKLPFLFKHLNQPVDEQDKITPSEEIMTDEQQT